jgi:DNA-binding LacI/PurR family transcriptional regulator
MPRRPTVYDVAAHAGVSIATVSFTFSRPDKVRPATRDAVLAAAESLGYVPSGNARGLVNGRTGAIGFYSFDYAQESESSADARRFPLYVDEVQRGVQLECRRHGYALMLGAARTAGDLPAVVDVAGRVDALIAFEDSAPPAAIAQVAKRIPVVKLGGETDSPNVHTVLVDNHTGMRELTGHLLTAHGFRRLAYLGGLHVPEFVTRYRSFAAALADAGIPAPAPIPSHPSDAAGTIAAVTRHLSSQPLPEAFVCATDQEALIVIDTLRAAGISVPAQVAVTGFDGTLAGQIAQPRLTTVRQPMEEIGRTAVQILVKALTGTASPSQIQLPAPFTPATSCGCPPQVHGSAR